MSRWERLHGGVLVATATCVPLGEGAAAACLVALGICLLLRWRDVQWPALAQGPIGILHGGWLVWLAAGCAAAALSGHGFLRPGELGRWIPMLCVPTAVLSATCLPRRWLRWAATGFVVGLVTASLFGLVQYAWDIRPGELWVRGHHGAMSQALVPGQTQSVAGGFYFHRLKMAHVLLVGLSVMLPRQMVGRLTPRRRGFELLVLALFFITLLLTFTRGALLGCAASGLGCMVFASRRCRILTAGVALCLALGVASAPQTRHRIASITQANAADTRAFIWLQGARILTDYPLGVGLGNYSQVVRRYYDSVDPTFDVRTYPHSVWLTAWAETGPVGWAGYVWAWCTFLTHCVRQRRCGTAPHDTRRQRTAAAGFAAGLAFWTVGLTHDILYHPSVGYAFCGAVGLCLADLFASPAPQTD